MPWKHIICEGMPGRLTLNVDSDGSRLVIEPREGQRREFRCSPAALMGAARGLRTYLASPDGECELLREGKDIRIRIRTAKGERYEMFVPMFEVAGSLARLRDKLAVKERFFVI